MVLLQRNSLHHIRSFDHQSTKMLRPIYSMKFPTNSRSIFQIASHSIYKTKSSAPNHSINLSPFMHLTQSRLASSSSKRTASTATKPNKNPLNQWNLSHRQRATLRTLGYWSPRIVIIVWFSSVVLAGMYLLKKSIDTDGFSTQFSPGCNFQIKCIFDFA